MSFSFTIKPLLGNPPLKVQYYRQVADKYMEEHQNEYGNGL